MFTAALPSINFKLDFCGPVELEDGAVAGVDVAGVGVGVGVAVVVGVIDKG